MAKQSEALKRRLSNVRRRWKAGAALDGALLVATEALGLFMLFMLADAIYNLSGQVRLGLLGAGLAVLAVLFVRSVVRPLLLRIPDEQIALYIEERSPEAEGSVISALECVREPKGGLSRFIAGLLVGDAVHRIDRTNVRAFSNLARLKKHLLVAVALLAAYAGTTLSFPEYAQSKTQRIIAPWESIISAQEEAVSQEEARLAHARWVNRPIEIDLQPKGLMILRGKGIEFLVTLSRQTAAIPVFHYQFAGTDARKHAIEMEKGQSRLAWRLPFRDINDSFKYHVVAAGHRSEEYEIGVYDPLSVRGIELTCHFPDYLQRDPQTSFGSSGDVTALAGTRIDFRVVANNPLKSGILRFSDPKSVPLKPGAKPQDGATASFTVEKDTTYTYEIADAYGETFKFADFFFVKAVPDKPPTIAMVSPKVDMSIHPLCEVTFAAKVADDFGIGGATAQLTYYRGGHPEPMPLPTKPAGQADFKNFLEGKVEHVLELEKLTPSPKLGDMIFYYMEVTDRKGQSVKTDLFFVKLMPLEVAAAWPASPTPPDLPHWDYLWTPDIILLAAAAWHIEQQRGKIPAADFNAQCTELAGRMEPAMNSQHGLNLLGGKQKLPKEIEAAAAELLAKAREMLTAALQLVRDYEPGKAALEMQRAMALAESLNTAKALQELEMHQAPIHTGQPSGGYNQDAVMEQAEFRLPEVMSDSLTAFQQEDNPRHFLPPDYRRALRLKERTAPLTKELKLAGEIYASQEQLLEMAREAFGHRKLREAAEMSCTNDPAAGAGTKGDMIRVDKRAVPWASMDPRADMPDAGSKGQMNKPETERVKGLRYARLRDNERAGPASPHRSQTPGGSADDDDEQEKQEPKKKGYTDEQWKVVANDRRPQQSQGGGGGGGEQQQQPPPPGMDQAQQQSGGAPGSPPSGAEQQLAANQAALADRAAQLARSLSKDMEPGDALGQRSATAVRDASREMRQAAASFQRGDLRTGIAQARRAQQEMRSAMHGLRAAQAGSLAEALAAAQQGAATLAQNQYRVSQGTRQLEQRIRDLAGETPGSQPGPQQPGEGQPGKGEPGKGQPGKGQQSTGEPGKGQPGKREPGTAQPGKGQPGKGEPGKGRPGRGQPGKGEPGKGQPGGGEPGEGPTTRQLAAPAEAQRAAGPSQAAVAKAKAQDPRVAANMQSLAGEQLNLSESVKDLDSYVGELTAWSKEAEKDRVTTSLKDVTDGLKQDDVAQKMVDAGVDLSQQDIGSARATQEEIEAALGKMTGRLREANDMLAGSKTGILSRAAREAKDISNQVRQLAGLPSRDAQPGHGQPSQGQPSQAQPGQGQPSQGQPSQGQPGQGQPGQNQPSQARPGESQPAQGQPGQGQPGEGQPSQGQPSQGQPGRAQPERGQPGKRADSLADRLADEERRQAGMPTTAGRPGPGTNVPGGAGRPRDEVDALWLKTADLATTLRDEELADQTTLDYIHDRVKDPESFRRLFDKVKKAEAGRFSDVVMGVGKSLDEVLKETLSAKKLHSERSEECPPQYRSFVDAYFEALSKAATGKAQ